MKKCAHLAVFFLLVGTVIAQNIPAPPAPADTAESEVITNAFAADAVQPVQARTADRSFLKWNGGSAVAHVADMALTAHCVGAGTCREMNPLLGAHPSAGRLFGTSMPLMATQIAVSYYLRKHNNKNWKIPAAVGLVAHVAGAASNLIGF